MNVGAVIVAAGMSARMNDFKQLMKIGDLSMAERVVVNFQQAGVKNIVMVTGFQAKKVEKELQHSGITFLRNDEYETTEMFDSAKIGLSYLKDICGQVLFCPADVPFFSERTVEKLLEQEGRLVYPVCDGRMGHPVRIDTSLIPRILEYKGDRGLKGALDSLGIESVMIQVDDEGAVTDADTEEDYRHLLEMHDAGLMRTEVKVSLVKKKTFFGPDTVTILKLIDKFGSVREACRRSGFSYSKGWALIRTAEEELGYKIVVCQPGGKNGGQAYISEKGRRLLELFEIYTEKVEESAETIYNKIFLKSDLL